MARTCQAHGVKFFSFLQPNQYMPGAKVFSEAERRIEVTSNESDIGAAVRRRYPQLLLRGAELIARGVAFHDFSRLFKDEADTIYQDACCHINRRGNQIMAKAMVEVIRARLREPK